MARTKSEFLEVFKFFSKASYFQKVEYMKENWGIITSEMTISYGEGYSVTVGINELNKYYFDFECKDLLLDEFVSDFPEYANALLVEGEEALKNRYPEVLSFTLKEGQTEPVQEENVRDLNEQEVKDIEYMNMYRGIKINNKE